MIGDLKSDTASWQIERDELRRADHTASNTWRSRPAQREYTASNTWKSRIAQGASGVPIVHSGEPAFATPDKRSDEILRAKDSSSPAPSYNAGAPPPSYNAAAPTPSKRAASHPGQSVRTLTSPMSAMSSAGAGPKTARVYIPVGHWFSSFAKDFADIEAGDHAECERFVSQHPDVFELDEQDFLKEALAALRTERPDYAKRCVQRFILLEKLREMSFRERQSFFKGLIDQDDQAGGDFLLYEKNLMASLRVSLPKVTEIDSKRKSTMRTHRAVTFQRNDEAIQANHHSGEDADAEAMRSDATASTSKQTGSLLRHDQASDLGDNTISRQSSSLPSNKLGADSAAITLPGETDIRVVVPEASHSGLSKALNIKATSGVVSKTSSKLAVTGAIDTARLAGDVAALAVGGYGWYDGHRNNEEAIKLREQTLKDAEQSLRHRTGIFEYRELALDTRKRALDEETEKQRKNRIDIERRENETSALAEQLQKQKLVLDQTEFGHIRHAKEFAAEQLKFRNSKVAHENYGKKLLEDQLETAREKEEVQETVRALKEDQEAFEDAEKLAYAVQSDLLMEVNRKMEELASMQREFLQKIAAEKKQLQMKAAEVQKDSEALDQRQRDFEINQGKHKSRMNLENETSRTDKEALFMKQRNFDAMYLEKPGLPSAKTTINHKEHPVHVLLAAKSSFLAPPVLEKSAHQLSSIKLLPSTVEAMLAAKGSLLSRQEWRVHVDSYPVGKQAENCAENCDEKVKASRDNAEITSFESFGSQTALETVITGTSDKATPVRRTSLGVKQKRNSRKLSLR
jgi:hypothetical protein